MLLVIAASLCCFISSLASAFQGHTVVRVKSGQNTALHCPCLRDKTITLEWIKFELQSHVYISFSRNSHETYLHPSFKDRVELKDGDLTLILKTVSIRDTGIYECCVEFKNRSISGRLFTCRHYFNLTVTAAEQKNITAGQTVVLPCRTPNDNGEPNAGVRWSRPDLDPQNVLSYLDKKLLPEEQHPSFKNRVDLQDRQMKDGDASLILKDVMTADSGTYECRVFRTGTNCGNRVQQHINTIILGVVPPGPTGGDTEDGEEENDRRMKNRSIRLVVGLCVFGVFVGVVCFLIRRRHKEPSQNSNQPPAEQQQLQMLQLNHESPAPLPSDLSTDRK